jgi:hypothetical protein
VLGRDRSCFVKINHWFYQKVLWSWYHELTRVYDWQHICYLWWTCFSTDSRHTYGYKLLADLFLYSYEADFIHGLLKKYEKKLTRSFNFTFRYIYDVLSLNNSCNFVDRIYPIELEIKDTTDTDIRLLHTLTYTSKLTVRGR